MSRSIKRSPKINIKDEDILCEVANLISKDKTEVLEALFEEGLIPFLDSSNSDSDDYETNKVFQIGSSFYRIKVNHPSHGSKSYYDWDFLTQVTPKTKEVVYYE